MPVRSLDRENALEEIVAAHFSILVWRIPWTEEPGRLQLQRVGHNLVTEHTHAVQSYLQRHQEGWESPQRVGKCPGTSSSGSSYSPLCPQQWAQGCHMTRTPAREAESLPCPSLLGVGTYPTLFPPVLQALLVPLAVNWPPSRRKRKLAQGVHRGQLPGPRVVCRRGDSGLRAAGGEIRTEPGRDKAASHCMAILKTFPCGPLSVPRGNRHTLVGRMMRLLWACRPGSPTKGLPPLCHSGEVLESLRDQARGFSSLFPPSCCV